MIIGTNHLYQHYPGVPNLLSNTKMCGVFLPNFNSIYYLTKSVPAMSDDEFKEAIIEQAKKDQAAGKCQESQEYFRLMKNYTSVVSPDREGCQRSIVLSQKRPFKLSHFPSQIAPNNWILNNIDT